ncbi:major facilitator super transporter protein [Podila humilis]|nr:major facilitator super transporter protein [Podila humilis]
MRPWILCCILLASSACQLVGIIMFAKGFFPYKTISSSFASQKELPVLPSIHASPTNQGSEERGPIQPRYGKVVLMLVDALRSLIDSHQALPFTALASAPTVTLPRLKALTTGTVPSFLDAVLNIAESDKSSTLENQDSWIAQMTRSKSLRKDQGDQERQIAFFGDDTWIKLFPGQFFRLDGTSSFFAMDTVEVDANVTRHVLPELAKDDWDALIFHYLGLDHVGHSGGPKSALMRPKQVEMDGVVKDIYTTLTKQHRDEELPTLFVLCGDHGMNEVGNHGGSSRSEISTAFLFLSPHFEQPDRRTRIKTMLETYRTEHAEKQVDYQYYRTVNQVDLVPTISLLLGLPIPKNSVGKLIPELFDDYTEFEKLRALQINGFQVADVLKGIWSDFDSDMSTVIKNYVPTNELPAVKDFSLEKCARKDTDKQQLSCWYAGALISHASFLEMTREDSSIQYKASDISAKFHEAEELYFKFLSESSSMLSTALSNYDMPLLTNGSLVMAFAVAGFMYCAMQTTLLADLGRSTREPKASKSTTFPHTVIYTTPATGSPPSIANVGFSKPLLQSPFSSFAEREANEVNWTLSRGLSAIILILYLATLFASSFVEEEHQFWYFFNMTWWAVLGITSARYLTPVAPSSGSKKFDFKPCLAAGYCFGQMVILRLLRAWNQTGQKYADQTDLRHFLNSSWIGASWLAFVVTMVAVASSLITSVHSFQRHTKQQSSDESQQGTVTSAWLPFVNTLQALLVVLILMVTSWTTLYKMDLECSYFGDVFMDRIHQAMIRISAIGYSNVSPEESLPLAVSGFELARGCYLGLGLILVLVLTLKGLAAPSVAPTYANMAQSGISLTDKSAASKIHRKRPNTLFVPVMILGATTLLLILLSRRHNAPIYLFFGIQLWMYLEWISLVRERPVDSSHESPRSATAYMVDTAREGNNTHAQPADTLKNTSSLLQFDFRTLPGQSSIHSCTVLLWIMASFFFLGNSNSIASIDISNAYVGIQAYDILLTGVLTFVSNWAGPIWWSLATVVIMIWDLEWELAWTVQASELENVLQEEQAWVTVQGWRQSKEDKKLNTSRKTRRQAAREFRWKALQKQQPQTDASSVLANPAEGTDVLLPTTAKTDSSGTMAEETQPVKPIPSTPHSVSSGLEGEGGLHDTGLPEEEMEYLEDSSAEDTPSPGKQLSRMGYQRYRIYLAQTRMTDHLVISSLFFGVTLYALSIAAIILRHHLFIWTVFSPKVLYQFAWTALYQIVMQTVLVGGGVWALVVFV